jgi:hypothetical protein
MIKALKHIFLVILAATGFSSFAQTTTSSPYSTFGLGNLKGSTLPHSRAMGGVSAGLRRPGAFFSINPANPASYSAIQLTTFDIGAYGNFDNLAKSGGVSETGFNGALSHISFAIPVTRKSALSFGLLPYSEVGYTFRTPEIIGSDTASYVYDGDGGISKAYLGYGFNVTKNLSAGFNVSYLFGKLSRFSSMEFDGSTPTISSRAENSTHYGGLSFDYGLQYAINLSPKTRFTLGYSGTAKSKINSNYKSNITRYILDESGNESVALDTVFNREGLKAKTTLPLTHTAGFTFEKTNKWMLGADVSFGQWSDYREGDTNPQLQNTLGFAVGGQITPDLSAVSNYFKLIDYRLGFKYDQTYVNVNNTDIKQTAITFGFGFPLPSNRSTFYKINLGAELGQRGTMDNNLVRERFANIYLAFTLNDRWFQKYKFD